MSLDRFHVLIGPNASGKSTLFDALTFLGDLVRDGLESAVGERTSNFQDLVWGRPSGDMGFELAIELDVPENLRERLPAERDFRNFRYEIAIRGDDKGVRITSERALLMPLRKCPPPSKKRNGWATFGPFWPTWRMSPSSCGARTVTHISCSGTIPEWKSRHGRHPTVHCDCSPWWSRPRFSASTRTPTGRATSSAAANTPFSGIGRARSTRPSCSPSVPQDQERATGVVSRQ